MNLLISRTALINNSNSNNNNNNNNNNINNNSAENFNNKTGILSRNFKAKKYFNIQQ